MPGGLGIERKHVLIERKSLRVLKARRLDEEALLHVDGGGLHERRIHLVRRESRSQ
jgi:hypothetical protein